MVRPTVSAPASLRRATRLFMCDAPPAEAAVEREEPFAKLDVRVGKIVEAWPHPESDKLWCEKIDVGEEEPREIASGIRAYYAEAADLVGKSVLVVCNLKPAKLGGFPSNGMVFCGTSADKSKVEFVEPPAEAQPGERVVCEGWDMPEPASANQVRRPSAMRRPASSAIARSVTLVPSFLRLSRSARLSCPQRLLACHPTTSLTALTIHPSIPTYVFSCCRSGEEEEVARGSYRGSEGGRRRCHIHGRQAHDCGRAVHGSDHWLRNHQLV